MRADVRPSRLVVAVAAVFAALNVVLFVLIAEDLLDGGGLMAHDQAVLNWFVDHRTNFLEQAARLVSTLGGFVGLLVLAVLLALVLILRRWRWEVAVAPGVALLLAGGLSALLKASIGRGRPPVTVHAVTVSTSAFPSGHATDAAAFFLAASFALWLTVVTRTWPRVLVLLGGIALAGLVGLSRLVLGVHWLSDVVAGWVLGNAIATTVVLALWWWGARSRSVATPSVPASGGGDADGDAAGRVQSGPLHLSRVPPVAGVSAP